MREHFWTLERGVLSRADRLPLTAADSLRAGLSLGRMQGSAVGLGRGDSPAARALLLAAESGILQNGRTAWDLGSCFESQFFYTLSRSGADYGMFVSYAGEAKLCARGGLPLSPGEERQFLELMDGEEPRPVFAGSFGTLLPMESLGALYGVELIKAAETTLTGMAVCVKCANPLILEMMEKTLTGLGCRLREGGMTLQISADGKDVAAYESVQDYIYTDRVLLLVCRDLFSRGQDAAVPASAPRAIDAVAASCGRQVFRYDDGLPSGSDRKARSLSLRQPFLRDGLMLGLRLLSVMKRRRMGLSGLVRELPGFAVVSRTVAAPAGLREGMVLAFPSGELRVRPCGGRKAALLTAECTDMEAAAELCRFGEAALQRGELRSPGE